MSTPPRVAIHGSCVSRDTVTHLAGSVELLVYVARQSLLSVGSPAAGVAGRLDPIASPFQERMVRGDLRGDALDVLAGVADRVDVLLLDLVDERSGVLDVGGGTVTRLAELWAAGGARATAGARHLRLGEDEHLRRWTQAAQRYLRRLEELDLLERALLLRTPWASRLEDGTPMDLPTWMTPPDVANRRYEPYFAVLEEAGVQTVALPDPLAVSSAAHRWGPSPFHYADAAYAHLGEHVLAAARRHPAPLPRA